MASDGTSSEHDPANGGDESNEPADLSPQEAAFGHVGRRQTTEPEQPRDKKKQTLIPLEDVISVVEKVGVEVLTEDKMGTTRDMVAQGTCDRIERELKEEFGNVN